MLHSQQTVRGAFSHAGFRLVAKLIHTGAYPRLYASPLTSAGAVNPGEATCVVSWKPAQK